MTNSPNILSVDEIDAIERTDLKLFRLMALLEHDLTKLEPDLRMYRNERGSLVQDESGTEPDLSELIEFYGDRFPDVSAVQRSRQIRNLLAHPRPGHRAVPDTDLAVAAATIRSALETLRAIPDEPTPDPAGYPRSKAGLIDLVMENPKPALIAFGGVVTLLFVLIAVIVSNPALQFITVVGFLLFLASKTRSAPNNGE